MRVRRDLGFVVLLATVVVCLHVNPLFATIYHYPFEIFTDNGPWGTNGANFDDSDLNLFMEVSNGGPTVSFKLRNESQGALTDISIADVYFDDGTLLSISTIENGPGTQFSQIASPGSLPGGNILDPDFETTGQFLADSDPSVAWNGVNSGEWVIINFDLMGGGTLQNVLDELADGTLRVGIHIQGFPGDSSESAVHIPEPATICLIGLGALGLIRRKKIS